ncbi:hypothetical protein VNO77_03801 [Canavalia gladiata]|uniref:Uncharacterized protein n=1 Tax=Canavalia gladiata TaxID=3824 RepID=A0AAN9N0H8_CANGL
MYTMLIPAPRVLSQFGVVTKTTRPKHRIRSIGLVRPIPTSSHMKPCVRYLWNNHKEWAAHTPDSMRMESTETSKTTLLPSPGKRVRRGRRCYVVENPCDGTLLPLVRTHQDGFDMITGRHNPVDEACTSS